MAAAAAKHWLMSIVYAADLFSQGRGVAVVMPKLTRPCEVSGYLRCNTSLYLVKNGAKYFDSQ